ncbi:MAG: prefoldin subunit beta [Candidatus Aenigmarchaeota archaeon]|nr:prefoldin subunit beta [Candidatus Aenigmarchaeota archaeon]MCX8179358.1 prefoldin subunit beta [Candidatus Aenigmarchaeota archaeon]
MNEDVSSLINQYQLLQQQLQAILIQKENSKLELIESEKALEEIKKSEIKEVYKIVGQIMVKKDVEDVKKELEEKTSDLEVRLSAIEKTEQKISEKLKELEPKIQKLLG